MERVPSYENCSEATYSSNKTAKFDIRSREADRYRDRDHRATKLLYKKLESRLLDYLAFSLVSYTLWLIVDRGIVRARLSLVHTLYMYKRKYKLYVVLNKFVQRLLRRSAPA